ncbi:MAG: aspartate kinase [Clostridia bacterium]|nr:aspartate kinase [Clostridia bacterium]
MKVAKFGGSSLSDAARFEKVKAIIESDPERRVVVVSAPGKRTADDNKITDLLYTLSSHLKYGVPDEGILRAITDRFVGMKNALGIDSDIETEIAELSATFGKNTDRSFLVSRGEYFCAKLMSGYLGCAFVDAADVIRFSFDGSLDEKTSRELVKSAVEKYGRVVIPGFYGAYPNGDIHLFSRGGSDITGAYVASFLDAEIYENWTDVSGISSADPRIVENPKVIEKITYDELRELSYMGANVLHEDSILPVSDVNIDINILNTFDPDCRGTIITREAGDGTAITGIAGKSGFISFMIRKKHMSGEVGFLRKVLSVFEKYNISIEHAPTGMDMVTVIVPEEQASRSVHPIISEIESTLGATVELDRDTTLIAVVGRNMSGKTGICSAVFGILGNSGVNIKVLAQAPDELTIIIGVAGADMKTAIKSLYTGLCEKGLL